MTTVTVLKETAENEKRVALVPESVKRLTKRDISVLIQEGVGEHVGFTSQMYKDAGGEVLSDYDELLQRGKLFLKVQCVCLREGMMQIVDPFPKKSVIIGFFDPFKNIHNVEELADKNMTCFSMELIPRISRAQRMDPLSAMSSIAGYKAVLLAANHLNKFFPLMMTAAGTVSPAKVLIIGAGVAGLQAIATAKRLGAKVKVFDTRPVVKEQVESLGADFVHLEVAEETEIEGGYGVEMSEDFYRNEQVTIAEHIAKTDVAITTAQIFGKRAPLLITEEMVRKMPFGSVIIDLAAEQGGNCELTIKGQTVSRHGVTIIGPTDLPSSISYHASEMFSRNVTGLMLEIIKESQINIDMEDEVIENTILTHEGKIINKHVKDLLNWEKESES